MRSLASLLCALSILAFALPAHAGNSVGGKWESRITVPTGEVVIITFDLKSVGGVVTGTMTGRYRDQQSGPAQIQNGKLQGDTLTFNTIYALPLLKTTAVQIISWIRHFGVQTSVITGVVQNDEIRFIQHDWQERDTVFEAKRIK